VIEVPFPICCSDDGQLISAGGPSECRIAGGTWYTDRENCPRKICAFLGLLNQVLAERSRNDPVLRLAASGTFASLYDLRDRVLEASGLGRRLLEYYEQHSERAVGIIRSDPELLQDTLRAFLLAADFGNALVRVHCGATSDSVSRREYSPEAYEAALDIIARFRRAAGNDAADFDEALDFIRGGIEPLVGLPASAVLVRLGLESSGAA
jgi:hypothetical protein